MIGETMNYLKILLKEPLVHFLLIGAGLFLIYSFSDGPADDSAKRIVVSSGQVEQMVSRFTQTWMRSPLDEEFDGLIENYVRDEIFYREAVAMGLDRNDQTIKQRLRMKLEFLLEDLSSVSEISDQELTDFLARHPEKFMVEPRVSFRQVYLDPQKHHDPEAEAQSLLLSLQNGTDPLQAGDATMLAYEHIRVSQSNIVRSFGESFAEQVSRLDPGDWTGPFASQFGVHLVKVTQREEARLPELAEIRDQVEREYLVLRRQEMKDDTYQRLRAGYQVVIEAPEPADGAPGVAATKQPVGGGG